MIQTLAPGHYRDTFSLTDFLGGDDLAWVGQGFTLRVTGWSMFPTLRQGDVLRLLPPESVEPGDLVLFRHDRTLVCHRVVSATAGDAVRTRGDGMTGDGEPVRRVDLVGKVAVIVRGRTAIDPRAPQAATGVARIGRWVQWTAAALRARVAVALSRLLRACLRRAMVGPAARLCLMRSLSYEIGRAHV